MSLAALRACLWWRAVGGRARGSWRLGRGAFGAALLEMELLFVFILLALIASGLAVNNEKIIHMFWTPAHNAPDTLNRKVETAFRSALRTQTDARIIVWTHAPHVEKLKSQTRILQGLPCKSGATIEVRSTEELSELSRTSSDPLMHQCAHDLSGHGQTLQQQ